MNRRPGKSTHSFDGSYERLDVNPDPTAHRYLIGQVLQHNRPPHPSNPGCRKTLNVSIDPCDEVTWVSPRSEKTRLHCR